MTTFYDRKIRRRQVTLADLPPALAADRAFALFCTPKRSSRRSPDHVVLAERARFHLRNARWVEVETAEGRVQAYVFEPDPAFSYKGGVLIAHGWTSEASFMAVFAEQLRRAGFRVVAFDQPGHGRSGHERASLIDCSRALLEITEALGPIRFGVAHSMGGLALLLVGEGGPPVARAYPFERYVLVSVPNAFAMITREFEAELSLSPAAARDYERRLERIARRSISTITCSRLLAATGRPALLLHARDDAEVGFHHAEEIAAACPRAELKAFDGLGHRNILYAPPVIRAAVSYLSED